MGAFDFRITDPPAPGTLKSRVVSVSGVARTLPGPLPSHKVDGVRVQFGPGGPVVLATRTLPAGLWAATGTLPPSTPDDSDVDVTATAFGTILEQFDPDVEEPFQELRVVSIHLEPHPPELTITAGYPSDVTPASLPYQVVISGTTSGLLSGITGVTFAVDGGATAAATNDPPGDWSAWHAQLTLPEARNYPFTVTATDARGREATQSGAILVREPFEPTDPAIAFGPTTYVRELCDFTRQYVSVDGQPAGPDRAALAARFWQPYDRIADPEAYSAATAPVDQRRIAVEVLRAVLGAAVPADLDQRIRLLAYETLLGELGTSLSELRLARIAAPSKRAALAERLGILLGDGRPDRLDDLTLDPDGLTDDDLETLFGFPSLRRTDPFAPAPGSASIRAWRQAALRRAWQQDDWADRDGAAGPLPVIDPDHVSQANLGTASGDPIQQLWSARRDAIQAQADGIEEIIATQGNAVATFDQLMADRVGTIDIAALAGRDGAGEDVTPELAPLRLAMPAFRYLAGVRAMLAAGTTLLPSEWTDVRDILVEVWKLRAFETWRQEERAADVVLEPQQFSPDAPDAPQTILSTWRYHAAVHQDWQRTLLARAEQLDQSAGAAQRLVSAAEAVVAPAARDELLAQIGAAHDPPEPAAATAERLTAELCIDLMSDSDAPTTRADQAAQTLLEALVSLRSGRLATTGPPSWAITPGREPEFDREWEWMGSYEGWNAAITGFAYPENQLFPSLYLPNGLTLVPSPSYVQFLDELRAARVTPERARQLAQANWNRLSPTLDPALRDAIKDTPPVQPRTNQELVDLAAKLLPLYTPEHQQVIRELLWLAPVALGLSLTQAGSFTAALDWFDYAYAYRLPPAQRRIFPGLVVEHSTVSTFGRPTTWPADGTNPHEVAVERADAYTRFTVMSIARCLLAYADSEYVRNTAASNARARALYEAAVDLLGSADAAPQTGPGIPFPANPVQSALVLSARSNLDKIHRGLNIAAAEVDVPDGVSVLPSQYRHEVLVDRAKSLVAIAGQLEAAFLSAAEQADAGAYAAAQAQHDIDVARAMVGEADLKVTAAGIAVQLATSQRERAEIEADHYGELLAAGPNEHELAQLSDLEAARDLDIGGGLFAGLASVALDPLGAIGGAISSLSQAASLDAQIEGAKASFERQQEGWQLAQSLAIKDIEIGGEQIAAAFVQQQIAVTERNVADIQLSHAAATAEFLATKFTSAELFEWMSRVLNDVYAYFLRQATAVARQAQAQLAFERQEPNLGVVQGDYWQGPPDADAAPGTQTDRRGLTGSERLLEDLTRLDEYAFDTDRRKLHLTQTLSVAQIAGAELQRFKQTGVLTFATPSVLFDRRFPGHYLRLVRRVRISLIALVPPVTGVSATLSASGFSRVVVADGPFRTVTLRRDPESIAFTAPVNATGLFDQEPDTGMLLPFEGMGVDTVWRLELPKPANALDYRTIADVLMTIEYSALDDLDHRHAVIRALDRRYSADRLFSVQSDFPDTWYDLHNPDTVEDPAERMVAVLELTQDDFARNVTDLSIAQLTLFTVTDGSLTEEITISSTRHIRNGETTSAGAVTTTGGIVGTLKAGGAPWQAFLGADPTGTWEFQLEDTPDLRGRLQNGSIQDLVLALTLAGTTPDWP